MLDNSLDVVRVGVDEQCHSAHKGRQMSPKCAGLLKRDGTLAVSVKNEAHRIRARLHGRLHVFLTGKTTNFYARANRILHCQPLSCYWKTAPPSESPQS